VPLLLVARGPFIIILHLLALLALPFSFLDGLVLKVGKSCIPALGTAPLSFSPYNFKPRPPSNSLPLFFVTPLASKVRGQLILYSSASPA
jgi:hypothetical protein